MTSALLVACFALLLAVSVAQHYIGRQQSELLADVDEWTMSARLLLADIRDAQECAHQPCEQPPTHGDKCARHAPTSAGVEDLPAPRRLWVPSQPTKNY